MPVPLQSTVTHSASFIRAQSVQRRLPILFGILAIAFNNMAVAATELGWLFSTAGTAFLLLAAKFYTANRANALSKAVQENTEYSDRLRQRLLALQRRTTKQIKLRMKGDRRLKKRVNRLSSKLRSVSEVTGKIETQVQYLQDRWANEEACFETIRTSAEQILRKVDLSTTKATSALDKVRRIDASVETCKNKIQGFQDALSYQHWCYFLCISSLWQGVYQGAWAKFTDGDRSSLSLCPQLPSSNIRSLLLAHDRMTGNDFYKSLDNYNELILVHQMGKVGSMSIYDSLKSIPEVAPKVFHTHVLNPESVPRSLHNLVRPDRIRLHSSHFLDSLYIWNQLNQSHQKSQKSWKIITLVREPIARNISAYFQNVKLELVFPRSIEQGTIDLQELEEAIDDFKALENYKSSLSWMERQVRDVFGIDVYQEDFDHARGYKILKQNNVSLVVIKLEKLTDNYKEAFRDLLGIEDFDLQSSNVADDKKYAWIYKAFKQRIVLSAEYIDLLYSSKLATHFYTPQELETFRAKWTRNTM